MKLAPFDEKAYCLPPHRQTHTATITIHFSLLKDIFVLAVVAILHVVESKH